MKNVPSVQFAYKRGLPAAINFGGRSVAWLEAEIVAWINDRVKVSRGESSEAAR
jgi:predicted DNA-binding transcriptional regulator AlpA